MKQLWSKSLTEDESLCAFFFWYQIFNGNKTPMSSMIFTVGGKKASGMKALLALFLLSTVVIWVHQSNATLMQETKKQLGSNKPWTDYPSTSRNMVLDWTIVSTAIYAWTPLSAGRASRQEINSINRALSCEIGKISPVFKNKYTGIQSKVLASRNLNPIILQL